MWRPQRAKVWKKASGTATIKRDSYSSGATGWWDIRKEVFKRDGGVCQDRSSGRMCGKPGTDVHHIRPLSKGGTTTKPNLITVCEDHHQARHTHMRIKRHR